MLLLMETLFVNQKPLVDVTEVTNSRNICVTHESLWYVVMEDGLSIKTTMLLIFAINKKQRKIFRRPLMI